LPKDFVAMPSLERGSSMTALPIYLCIVGLLSMAIWPDKTRGFTSLLRKKNLTMRSYQCKNVSTFAV
jgi:hypothetical protein